MSSHANSINATNPRTKRINIFKTFFRRFNCGVKIKIPLQEQTKYQRIANTLEKRSYYRLSYSGHVSICAKKVNKNQKREVI